MNSFLCSLCGGKTSFFDQEKERIFVRCGQCRSALLLPEFYLPADAEEARYRNHNNDVTDVRYQKFVSPITEAVKENFPASAKGLDFGCGTGPVAAVELQKAGYQVNLYDPFFEDHPEALEQKYDFIICCEVMEHFHHPYKEFCRLKNLLNPGGKLYCKTSLFKEEIPFADWYYKNDPTHVFLYSEESLEWIRDNFGFRSLVIESKMIVFGT